MSNKTLMATYLAKRAELEFMADNLEAVREVVKTLERQICNSPGLVNILSRDGVLTPCGRVARIEGATIRLEGRPKTPVLLEELDNVSGDMYG